MDLKIKDVAELLNVSETTIRRWLTDGKIPAYRMQHQYRFSRIEIEDWMMSCRLNQASGDFLPEQGPKVYPIKDSPLEEEIDKKTGLQQFSLYRAINRGEVIVDLNASTKEDVISLTMQQTADTLTLDASVLTELLLDREKLMPTALNHGIAVPHSRDLLLKGPVDVITVVFPKSPIDWGALDEKPIHTLLFLFAADDKRHLHLLAKIAHLSSNDEALDLFRSKPDKKELLSYIKQWESKVAPRAEKVLC